MRYASCSRGRGPRNGQAGFSLVEFMIASTLGLIVVLGITNMFVASQRTNNLTRALSDIQQDGRYGMEMLSRSARRAGSFPMVVSVDGSKFNPSLDYIVVNQSFSSASSIPAIVTKYSSDNSGPGGSDVVGILAHYVSTSSSATTDYDCVGGTHNGEIWVEEYYLSSGSLYCKPYRVSISPSITITQVSSVSPQPLMDGVSNLQVEYGIDTDASMDYSVNAWTSIGGVANVQSVVALRFWLTVQDDFQGVDPLSDKTFTTTRFFRSR